jgi:hypothetical protein
MQILSYMKIGLVGYHFNKNIKCEKIYIIKNNYILRFLFI